MKRNQNGFSHLEVIIVVVVVGLIGLTGWYVLKHRGSQNKQANKTTNTSAAIKVNSNSEKSATDLDKQEVEKLKQTPAKSSPVSTSTTPATTTPTTPAATPAVPASTPPNYSITFSADGCMVSGYSVAGTTIEIGSFSSRKGGSMVYDISSAQTITKSAGGIKGMTAFGKTMDAQGNTLAYNSAVITVDSCPAAG